MPINARQMTSRRMKTLVIAIAALTIAACARGLDSYGYVPASHAHPGPRPVSHAKRGNKEMRSSRLRNDAPVSVPRALTISPDHLIAGGKRSLPGTNGAAAIVARALGPKTASVARPAKQVVPRNLAPAIRAEALKETPLMECMSEACKAMCCPTMQSRLKWCSYFNEPANPT
jgi:hypothetical protein